MNQYTFELTAQHRPEVLERVLRVIRLRISESVGEVAGCSESQLWQLKPKNHLLKNTFGK